MESLKGETITPELLARLRNIAGPMLDHLRQQDLVVHPATVEDGEIIIRVSRCRPQELLDAIGAMHARQAALPPSRQSRIPAPASSRSSPACSPATSESRRTAPSPTAGRRPAPR